MTYEFPRSFLAPNRKMPANLTKNLEASSFFAEHGIEAILFQSTSNQ
jgi:hypothetical protein